MIKEETLMSHLNQKVVEFVEASGTALSKAATALEQQATVKDACSKLVPDVVTALADHGYIEPHEKEAAADVLQDPVRTLQLLEKVATFQTDAEQVALGRPTASKQAGLRQGLTDPQIDAVIASPTDADRQLFLDLGLDFPAGA